LYEFQICKNIKSKTRTSYIREKEIFSICRRVQLKAENRDIRFCLFCPYRRNLAGNCSANSWHNIRVPVLRSLRCELFRGLFNGLFSYGCFVLEFEVRALRLLIIFHELASRPFSAPLKKSRYIARRSGRRQ